MVNINIKEADKCNGRYSLYVAFPYNSDFVAAVKELPERYWHNEEKQWEIPTRFFEAIYNIFCAAELHITGAISELNKTPTPAAAIEDFTYKTKPFKHQEEGLNYGLTHDRWLLGDEQGLGKTKQVIDIAVANKLRGISKRCLIVCCVNGLKWNWLKEVSIHSNENAHIIGQRAQRNGKTVIGSSSDKLYDLDHLNDIDAYFIITNVESLRNADIADTLKDLCKRGEISMIAVDEFHKCKDPTSQQSKGLMKLQADNCIAMTGTPLMNTPLDLYVIMKWLGYEKHSFYAFKNHYAIMGGYGNYSIVGYRHLEDLQNQLNNIMLRRLKEDVLDLPEKLYVDDFVDMSAKQIQIYNEVHDDIKHNIDKIKIAANPLAELIRLRQATGYPNILSSAIEESAKLDRLEEIVQDNVANGKKTVIFSNWTQVANPAYERLLHTCHGVLMTGDCKDEDRPIIEAEFQTDDNCKFIVGTIGAMGTGRTLTAGTCVVFLDEPWTMANKNQAIDRCHRIGTTSNITVYTIMCKNTIDERIHELVEKKGMMADALVDGKIIGNNAEMLNYLLS